MAKKKVDIIKDTPDDIVDDASFQNQVRHHVQVFGFSDVVNNVIETYRCEARRYNREADKLEKQMQKGAPR